MRMHLLRLAAAAALLCLATRAEAVCPTFTAGQTLPAASLNSCTQNIPVANIVGAAPLASPALTGTPTAPTAAAATNTTQVATTAMVQAAITAGATPYPIVAVASLPAVTATNKGAQAFATDCRNTGQGAGTGTGCIVVVNTSGVWVASWSGVAPTT